MYRVAKSQSGAALVLVLWMSMLLMLIAGSLVYASRTETQLALHHSASAKAEAAADAAMHQAVIQLMLPADIRTWKVGVEKNEWQWEEQDISVQIWGENGLININQASRKLLRKLLELVGSEQLDETAIETLLDRIEDFRDPDDLVRINGAEDDDYDARDLAYGAKDAPFDRIEELQQVLGMTSEIYNAMRRYLTANSGSRGVNPMLAPRHVLLLLAEGDAEAVEEYIVLRDQAKGAWVQPPFGGTHIDHSRQPFYRMRIKVTSDAGAVFRQQASIALLPGRQPPFIRFFAQPEPVGESR